MRIAIAAVVLLLVCVLLAQAQHPIPPGVREADKLTEPADVPPRLAPVRPKIDLAKLQSDANELAKLSQGVPAEIEQVQHGVLPKDLGKNLKEIEKLSKHLRHELDL